VDPAGGSTVSKAAATNPVASSARTGSRAPARTAARPTIIPPQPLIAAAHNAIVAAVAEVFPLMTQGGPAAGREIRTVAQLLRSADAAIMISSAAPIPNPADQARPVQVGEGPPPPGAAGKAGQQWQSRMPVSLANQQRH